MPILNKYMNDLVPNFGRTSVNAKRAMAPHGLHACGSIGALALALCWAAQANAQESTSQEAVADPSGSEEEEEIVVTGIRSALESSASKKRQADNIKDVVTAEDIGKFPDENITDSLARITGVQITREFGEGNGFTIRGISQNRVEVNGRTTIGRDEGRNPTIGDISSDLLSGVEVIKSPTADMVEGSLGGTVNLITRRAFDFREQTASINLRQGYTTKGRDFMPNINGLITDRWETGIGEIGALLNASYSINELSEDRANLGGWNGACNFDLDRDGVRSTAAATDSDRDGVLDTCADQGDFLFRPTSSNLVATELTRDRLGFVGSLQWRPSENLSFYLDGNYNQFKEREIKYSLQSGAVAPTGEFNQLLDVEVDENRNATMVVFAGLRPQSNAQTTKRDSTTYSLALGGEWDLGRLNVKGEAALSSGESNQFQTFIYATTVDQNGIVTYRSEGDLFSIEYNDAITGGQNMRATEFNNNTIDIKSDERSARLDFDWALNSGILTMLEFGGRITGQTFNRERFRYLTNGRPNPVRNLRLSSVPAFDGLYYDANLSDFFGAYDNVSFPSSWLSFNPFITLDGDSEPFKTIYGVPAVLPRVPDESYVLEESTAAGYVKLNVDGDLGPFAFRGNAGVRYVQSTLDSDTTVVNSVGAETPLQQRNKYGKWLPSANLILDFGDQLLTRFAFAKTMVRPSFDQLRPAVGITFTSGLGTAEDPYDAVGGNPVLDPFEATQYDVSIEKYFGPGNLISVAFYYRDVGAFIRNRLLQGYTLPNGLVVDLVVPENGSNASVKGAEAGIQYAFDFLPGFLSGFGVVANYTYADSKTMDRDRFGNRLQLEDLSKHTYNVSGYYERNGLSARLSYNWRSKRLTIASGQANRPQYQTPEEQLDLSLGWEVNPQFRISFDARNLTKRLGREYNETFQAPTRIYYDGTKYTLGFGAKF